MGTSIVRVVRRCVTQFHRCDFLLNILVHKSTNPVQRFQTIHRLAMSLVSFASNKSTNNIDTEVDDPDESPLVRENQKFAFQMDV